MGFWNHSLESIVEAFQILPTLPCSYLAQRPHEPRRFPDVAGKYESRRGSMDANVTVEIPKIRRISDERT